MQAFLLEKSKMIKSGTGAVKGAKKSEVVANHDAEGNSASLYLRRTKDGKYFLETETLQVRKGGKWVNHPADGSASNRGLRFRWSVKNTPMTEDEAIDWYLKTVTSEPLAKGIQKRIGYLVSFELGDLAKPMAAYCKRTGMTPEAVLHQAIDEALHPRRITTEIETAILLLQNSVKEQFGYDFDEGGGAGTIYISHGAVNLTNPSCRIVAQRASSIARKLTE